MNYIESHIINSSPELLVITNKTRNLYNKVNYIIRQEFINNKNYLSKYTLYTICKDLDEYKCLPARVARGVIRTLDANWKGFFIAIKDYKKSSFKYTGRPKLPKYLKKEQKYFTAIFTDCAVLQRNLNKTGKIGLSSLKIQIDYQHKENRIIEAYLIPYYNKFKINITYEKESISIKEDNNRYYSIDLGVNNLMTITSNDKGIKPLIINGRLIKALNQYYNKRTANLTSQLVKDNKLFSSKRLKRLNYKRTNKINDYFHKASKLLVDNCVLNNINTIIIGHNPYWKQKSNMGKVNNQKFISIPFDRLIKMIQYKALSKGIKVLFQEESYTSKSSFLNLDKIPVYNGDESINKIIFSGERIKRGLYKTNSNIIINSDVNGSYNILRKAIPKAFANGIEGFALNPIKVTL